MASYIKSGLMQKLLLSPKIEIYPDKWLELEKECEILDAKLDKLRSMPKGRKYYYVAPMTDEAREIIKKLSRLEAIQHEILMDANPKYRDYWFA